MARVTVEDCIDKVDSPYELVLVAKERATQLNSGLEPTLDRDNDKNTVIALREIAEEKIKPSDLTEAAIYKLRKIETVYVEIPGAFHNISNRPSQLITKIDHILYWFNKYLD